MSGRMLTDMADVLRRAGLRVVEQQGWQGRARSSGGYASGRPFCIMWHHTASGASASAKSDTDYMSFNSSNRPVANIMIARNGEVWVLAAGATNTNGQGNARQFSRGTVPANSMNSFAIGMEIQNTGVGQAYSPECIDAAFRTSLALCAAYGLRPDDVDTHVGYAPGRKIDPATAAAVQGPWRPRSINSSGSWNLDDLRAELRRRASTGPGPTPKPPDPDDDEEDDDMKPFLIRNLDNGGVALVYGDGKVTGLDGDSLPEFINRYGNFIDMPPVTFNDFASKGG